MTVSATRAPAPKPALAGTAALGSLRDSAAFWRTLVLIAALLLWEALARVGVINELFVSKPSSIGAAALRLFVDPRAVTALGETLASLAAAFTIGTGLGILAGVVLGLQPLLRQAYLPVVMMLMGTPKSAFLPVFIIFFGLGGTSAVAFGALMAFVHVTVNVVAGIDLVEPKHLLVARAYRATPLRRFFHVIIPGAAPGLFAAIWHGLRNGFVGVVVAELFASTSGIGNLVKIYTNNFQTAEALALVLTISVAVIVVGTGWNKVESRFIDWRGEGAPR